MTSHDCVSEQPHQTESSLNFLYVEDELDPWVTMVFLTKKDG